MYVCFISLYALQEGLSKVGPQAERSSYSRQLFEAEERAKTARKKVWEDYTEPEEEAEAEEEEEEKVDEEKGTEGIEHDATKKDDGNGDVKPTENGQSPAPVVEKKTFHHKVSY